MATIRIVQTFYTLFSQFIIILNKRRVCLACKVLIYSELYIYAFQDASIWFLILFVVWV